MDITNILGALTSGEAANELGGKLNMQSSKVSSIINSALPMLLQGMQKNVSTQEGASALNNALDHHAGNAGNIGGLLKNADLTDGSKILGHIFGGNLSSMIGGLAKDNGAETSQVSNILSSIAPSLLALLGKAKQSVNIGSDGLGAMLGTMLGGNGGSIIGKVLSDKDGDGSPDLLKGLGNIFKR